MIWLVIIAVLILIKKALKPYEGPVVLIFANLRTGKTTLLARIGKKEQKKMKKHRSKFDEIVSNTPIVGCKYVPKIRKLIQNGNAPERTLFLIDEGYLVWPNRKTKGVEPITDEEVEYIKLIGHYESKMVIVSQSYEDIDIIIRRIYTSMFLLVKHMQWTTIKAIKKYIDIDDETKQIVDAYKFRSILTMGLIFRPFYYRLFDTKWKPNGRVHPDFSEYEVVKAIKRKRNTSYFRRSAAAAKECITKVVKRIVRIRVGRAV